MAVSRNNRKKNRKRAQQRMSPAKRSERNEQREQERQGKTGGLGIQWVGFVGLILMVMGFLVAMFSDYGVVGYPVTFLGSAMCLSQTRWDTRKNKISIVSYIVYCALVALLWVQTLRGQL